MKPYVAIRPADGGDAHALVAFNERLSDEAPEFLTYAIDPASGADVLQAKLSGMSEQSDGDGVLLAFDAAGEIAGTLLLRRHLHPAFAGVLQVGVATRLESRRTGVARALLEAGVGRARAAGARRLQCAIIARNEAAISLFEAAGFQEEGRLRTAATLDGGSHDVLAFGLLL